jgi:hypothetical protein
LLFLRIVHTTAGKSARSCHEHHRKAARNSRAFALRWAAVPDSGCRHPLQSETLMNEANTQALRALLLPEFGVLRIAGRMPCRSCRASLRATCGYWRTAARSCRHAARTRGASARSFASGSWTTWFTRSPRPISQAGSPRSYGSSSSARRSKWSRRPTCKSAPWSRSPRLRPAGGAFDPAEMTISPDRSRARLMSPLLRMRPGREVIAGAVRPRGAPSAASRCHDRVPVRRSSGSWRTSRRGCRW